MTKQLTKKDLERLPHKQLVQLVIHAEELIIDAVSSKYKLMTEECLKVTKRWLRGEATKEECYSASLIYKDGVNVCVSLSGVTAWGIHSSIHCAYNAIHRVIEAHPDKQETTNKILTYYDNLLNSKYSRNTLIHGSPGVGKTCFAKLDTEDIMAIYEDIDLEVSTLEPSDLIGFPEVEAVEEKRCTCGAKYTSNPNFHLDRVCDLMRE